MRPRLLTARNFVLFLIAVLLLGGSAYWVKLGMPLPGAGVPSTAGRIAFVTESGGKSHLVMADADGKNSVTLTTGGASDRAPAWSPNGSDLAFVSENRAGINPQIFEMHAMPGANIGQLTRTDSAKDSPLYGRDGRIFYLDAGKVNVATADGSQNSALLPNHDQRTPQPSGHGDLFAAGGIRQAVPSPDGKHLAAVMHTERGDALLLYDMSDDQQALFLLGIADHIHVTFMHDGSLAAAFSGSEPFGQALPLFTRETDAAEHASPPQITRDQYAVLQLARNLLTDPDSVPSDRRPILDKTRQMVAFFDPTGKASGGFALAGFVPDSIAAAPDGAHLLVASVQEKGGGIFLASLKTQQVRPVFTHPARDLTWSPDGGRYAFAADDGIYVGAASESGGEPQKITTGGEGKSFAPVWSPARAKQ